MLAGIFSGAQAARTWKGWSTGSSFSWEGPVLCAPGFADLYSCAFKGRTCDLDLQDFRGEVRFGETPKATREPRALTGGRARNSTGFDNE
jgi:hypothetical protein